MPATSSYVYDAAITADRTPTSTYDAASNRIALTGDPGAWGYTSGYGYDAAGRLTGLNEAGHPVADLHYDATGRRSSLGLGFDSFPSTAAYTYDPVGRLQNLTHHLAGNGNDEALTFDYNPASQIVSRTSSNDSYASNTALAVSRTYNVNGLNQYTGTTSNGAPSATFSYDLNGNLTSDGANTYVYDAENRLVSASTGGHTVTLSYDPLGRLWQVMAPSGITRFLYDGDRLAIEYNSAGNVLRAYDHGAGPDEPLVWYEVVPGGVSRRYLHADHQGSIVAVADQNGNPIAINAYDEWGIPNASNLGRFGYTGQAWLPELGMWYYKARIYSPTLGRFLQTDPVGYMDQINLYAYVGNDPMDGRDPSGLDSLWVTDTNGITTVVIPIRYSGAGATPEAINRIVARAAALNTGDPKLRIQIVPTDKPIEGKLNKMDYSPGFDFKHYPLIGEGVNRVGGVRGHINSDATDATGNARDPEGAVLHDTLHLAGYNEGYTGGGGDGKGGRAPAFPRPGLTDDNIMVSRGGTRLTPGQSAEAQANPSSKACTLEIGSRIPRC